MMQGLFSAVNVERWDVFRTARQMLPTDARSTEIGRRVHSALLLRINTVLCHFTIFRGKTHGLVCVPEAAVTKTRWVISRA